MFFTGPELEDRIMNAKVMVATLICCVLAVVFVHKLNNAFDPDDEDKLLLKKFKSPDPNERLDAAMAFKTIGDEYHSALYFSKNADIAYYKDAYTKKIPRLRKICNDAIPLLVERLKDNDANVRCCAAESLGFIRLQLELTVPALTAAISDRDADVRSEALFSLAKMKLPETTSIKPFRVAQGDVNIKVRSNAVRAMGELFPTNPTAEEYLAEALADPEGKVRSAAALAFSKRQNCSAKAIAALIKSLGDGDTTVRWNGACIRSIHGALDDQRACS